MPLVASPANEWQTLFTVLKHAQHISAEVVGPEKKTIITLDMDLYMRALKLQMLSPDCNNKWILHIGEFHTVLCALRALGSTIENSGIDDAWVESGLYGPATVRQIIEGKHMKRALKVHALTVEVLYDLLFEECGLSQFHSTCASTIENLSDAANNIDYEKAKEAHEEITRTTVNSGFKESFTAFCKKQLSPMFKVTKEYMTNFENILLFIRASREGNWMAHLESLDRLCPLFFHQDRLKYAQHVPDYLARMTSLKDSDPNVWKEFTNGNFCVKKSLIPFTSIGVDHALEQENRKMKVLGGLKGITQKPETLARFFLIAPEMSRLSQEAEKAAGVTPQSRKQHHELSESRTQREYKRIEQLETVLKDSNPFQFQGDQLLNIISKSVMPQSVHMDILQREEKGKDAYHSFVRDRIQGPVILWEKMPKLNLKSWKSAVKTTKVVQGNRTIEMKENRSLFARMAIAARTRPDIDMKEAVGTYEFSSISRALFSLDGFLLPCNDKRKLLQILETMTEKTLEKEGSADTEGITEVLCDEPIKPEEMKKVIFIDRMVIVQQVAATERNVKSCQEFSELYIKHLEKNFAIYDVMHLVFDHYDVDFSLKQATRNRRAEKTKDSISYVCTDTTQIRTSLPSFIGNTKTKGSLAGYLAEKVLEHFRNRDKPVTVSTQRGAKSYHVPVEHLTSSQEEADTLLLLHAVSAAGPDVTIHILSPDTDVFVLALRHFPDLGSKTCVILGSGTKQRVVPLKPIYTALDPDLAAALSWLPLFNWWRHNWKICRQGKAIMMASISKCFCKYQNCFYPAWKNRTTNR